MTEIHEPSDQRANAAPMAVSAPSANADPSETTNPERSSLSRRNFLSAVGVVGVGAAAFSVGASRQPASAQTTTTPSPAQSPAAAPGTGDGILVLITMYGGNDGLDTLVPYADPVYQAQRGALALGADAVTPLDGQFALNKTMTNFKGQWDAGKLAIIRGVGYPDFNRSHFVSMDIWQSASPQSPSVFGWLGRWLDAVGHDPVKAVSVGPNLPRAFVGAKGSGSAIPVGSFKLPGGPNLERAFRELARPGAGAELGPLGARIAKSGSDLLAAQATIGPVLNQESTAADAGISLEGDATSGADYRSALDPQLEQISKMINAGLPTRVYGASLGGFDTHAEERGTHARLVGAVDGAIGRFLGRIASSANGQKVTVLVYSEFGRRVQANGSDGTDHGKANVVFAVGPRVRGGYHGEHPNLADLDDGDLKMTTDFRAVYATILERTLGFDPKGVLGQPFVPVPFL